MSSIKLTLLLFAFVAQAASAVPVAPDGLSVALPGTTVAQRPSLAGVVVEDEWTPFSVTANNTIADLSDTLHIYTGSVQSRVVRAVDGTYDFYWRIKPDAQVRRLIVEQDTGIVWSDVVSTDPVDISVFQLHSFASGSIDADWAPDGPGSAAPGSAVNPRPFSGGDTFAFEFGVFNQDPTFPGWLGSTLNTAKDSYFLFVDTDATAYAKTASFSVASLFDLGVDDFAGTSRRYATFAPVPEPETWALMLAGVGLIGAWTRRRRGAAPNTVTAP